MYTAEAADSTATIPLCADNLAAATGEDTDADEGSEPEDPDAPAECSKDGHTTADVGDCDARWKWSYEEHYVTGEQLDVFLEDPKYRGEITGQTFLQQDDDPYAFVDGDDVRCPETGEVHLSFKAVLVHIGSSPSQVPIGTGRSLCAKAP